MGKSQNREMVGSRYQILDKIGEGGMGSVYKIVDRLTDKLVALKQVNKPPSILQFSTGATSDDPELALANEFTILGSLRHPNIVGVLDFGFDEQRLPYFTMDLLEKSQTITEFARSQSAEGRIHLIMQLLQAMEYLHQRNIIHRDLKPANTLVTEDGVVKVLDFGLALSTDLARTSTASGTLAYLAPEVLMGQAVSVASDLYAVGVIAYEILSDRYPFRRDDLNTLLVDITNTVPDVSIFEPAVGQILAKLLSKNPADRYQDVDSVIKALRDATQYQGPIETLAIRESYLQAASFTGRETELAALNQMMQEMMQGKGKTVLISGESGVGKSRLVNELRVRALVENVLVLRGQAVHEGGGPFHIWKDILRLLLITTPVETWEASAMKFLLPDIERLVGYPVPDAADLSPQGERERINTAVLNVLARHQTPIILIFEDLQWAGDETLALIERVAQTTPNRMLLCLGTYRSDETPALPQQIPSAQVMTLDRFDAARIADLSASILGQIGREPQIVEFLKHETEGNIFFVIEVVRALADQAGNLRSIATMPLPAEITAGGVLAILRHRLDRVPADALPLLQLAAVRGRELDLALLSHLAPDTDLNHWVFVCSNLAVFSVEDERWYFAHDKLREQVLRDLEQQPDELRRLHRRIGEGLEALYPNTPQYLTALAHHWTQADDPEKASHYNEQAAQLMVRNATSKALEYIEAAKSFDSRLGEIPWHRHALRHSIVGVTHFATGNNEQAVEALEASLRHMGITPAPRSGLQTSLGILKQIGRQVLHRFFPSRFLGKIESAGLQPNMVFGLLTIPMLYGANGSMSKMLYSVLLNLNTLEAYKTSDQANPLMGYAWMHYLLGMVPVHSLSKYYRGLMLNILNDPRQSSQVAAIHQQGAVMMMGFYDYFNAQWDIAIERIGNGLKQLIEFGDLHSAELAHFYLGSTYELSGNFSEARQTLEEGYRKTTMRHDPEQEFSLFAPVAALLFRMGRLNAAEFSDLSDLTDTDRAEKHFEAPFKTNGNARPYYHTLQAAYHLQNQDEAQAWQALQKALQLPITTNDRNVMYVNFFDVLAQVCTMLLQNPRLEAHIDREALRQGLKKAVQGLSTYGKGFAFCRPAADLYQGWLHQFQNNAVKARESFQKALKQAQDLKMPYYEALTHLALATLEAADSSEYQAHMARARAISEQLGGLLQLPLT